MKYFSEISLVKCIIFCVILFSLSAISCKKDGKLSPQFDNRNLEISYVDTFSIVTSLIKEDSIRTDGLS